MDQPLKYNSSYNQLSAKESALLEESLISVQNFVLQSREISSVNYATRDAHSKSYGYLKGAFIPAANNQVKKFFPNASYDVLVRFSHAHLKIIKTERQLPVYGLALKIKKNHEEEINYPMVNFPVFITNSVTRFLNLFIGINRFYTSSSIYKPIRLIQVAIKMLPIMVDMMNLSFIKSFSRFIKTFPDFIMNRDYHSIGAYRWNDEIIKLKLFPTLTDFKPNKSRSIFENMQALISEQPIRYHLYAQFSYDEKFQPINNLKKLWINTPEVHFGSIELNEVLQDNPELEKLSFDPFDSPEIFQPVGKIQSLRKAVYETSVQTRNQLNSG